MSSSTGLACQVIRPSETYHGKQGLTYFCAIAAENVGSKGICMHLLTIPPAGAGHCLYSCRSATSADQSERQTGIRCDRSHGLE